MKSHPQNTHFYTSLPGSPLFLGQRFKAIWSITHSLREQHGDIVHGTTRTPLGSITAGD